MDETRRYHEPQKLGNILKDMGMDTQGIQQQMKSQKAGKKFADDIIKMMNAYAHTMDTLHTLYTQHVNPLINDMDSYYASERKSLLHAKQLVNTGHMTQKEINTRMQILGDALDQFELNYNTINTLLRKTIRTFASTKDQQEQTKKANDVHELFIDIYTDIDDIIMRYSKLLSKAPRT